MVCFLSGLCQRNQDDSTVLLASHTLNISLFHKIVDCNRQCSHCYVQNFSHSGHIFLLPDTHGIYNVHIINRNILIFRCDQRPFFQVQNLIKQIDQHIIDCLIMIHPVTSLFPINAAFIIHYIIFSHKFVFAAFPVIPAYPDAESETILKHF